MTLISPALAGIPFSKYTCDPFTNLDYFNVNDKSFNSLPDFVPNFIMMSYGKDCKYIQSYDFNC